jgi:hypothetical protein
MPLLQCDRYAWASRELAREHRKLGYSAAYCPQSKADDADRVRAKREAFAAENVVIAEVGAWKNMLDPGRTETFREPEVCHRTHATGGCCGRALQCRYCRFLQSDLWYGSDPKNFRKNSSMRPSKIAARSLMRSSRGSRSFHRDDAAEPALWSRFVCDVSLCRGPQRLRRSHGCVQCHQVQHASKRTPR